MTLFKLSGLCATALLLTACHSNSSNDHVQTMNALSALGNLSAEDDPVQIIDPTGLKQDIASLFGNADDDPLAVECGETDTLQAIIDRGGRA